MENVWCSVDWIVMDVSDPALWRSGDHAVGCRLYWSVSSPTNVLEVAQVLSRRGGFVMQPRAFIKCATMHAHIHGLRYNRTPTVEAAPSIVVKHFFSSFFPPLNIVSAVCPPDPDPTHSSDW